MALTETDHKNNGGNEVEVAEKHFLRLPPASDSAMDEYFRLQQNLLLCTLGFTAVIFVSVWWAYSFSCRFELFNRSVHWCGLLEVVWQKNVANIGRGQKENQQQSACLIYWPDFSCDSMGAA